MTLDLKIAHIVRIEFPGLCLNDKVGGSRSLLPTKTITTLHIIRRGGWGGGGGGASAVKIHRLEYSR